MKTFQVKQDVFLPLAAELESSLILETMDEQRTHTELKAGWKPCMRVYFSLDVLRRPTDMSFGNHTFWIPMVPRLSRFHLFS